MFVSSYETSLDSKGRVSVPAPFRHALEGGARIFLYPALDGSLCLEGGGDALMRVAPLRAVGGYTATLIAGEEPELCVRLRSAGWQVWRLEAEMTWHDAAVTRFGQWWKRTKRAGHAFAEGASLHGRPPERHWVTETRRALVWGAVLPLAILVLVALTGGWGLLLALIYPVQVLRLSSAKSLPWAVFTTLGKVAEAQGALHFYLGRLRGQGAEIIEYK